MNRASAEEGRFMSMDAPMLVVSLDRDRERRLHVAGQFRRVGVGHRIVPAVDAHAEHFDFRRYRRLSRGRWWDMDRFKPGAFGCSLSHAECWRQAKESAAPVTLIGEDDLVIEPAPFRALLQAELPSDFDVIFLNAGLTRFLDLAYDNGGRPAARFLPVNETVLQLVEQGAFTDLLTPGSYGYLVSRTGASRLLALMEREKVCMGVDYAMVFGSLTASDLERIQETRLGSTYLQVYLENCVHDAQLELPGCRVPLRSYIWNGAPIIRHRKEFGSSLDHDKFLGFDVFE